VHCPGVVFVGVNGSDNPNCQNCRLAQLPECRGSFVAGNRLASLPVVG